MNIWMYVIREMEDALDDCQEGCTFDTCNDDPVCKRIATYHTLLKNKYTVCSACGRTRYSTVLNTRFVRFAFFLFD